MIKDNKIVSVQYLRGLAALGVVFCHYGSSLEAHPILSSFFSFGQTGVSVFFLISGFIIVYSLSESNYRPHQFFTFLLKRSIRIDPSYYVAILLTLLLFAILSHIPSYKGNPISFIPGQFVAHLLYIVPFKKFDFYDHVFWTLCVEFQFYLLIGILYFLSDSNIYKMLFLVLFSLTTLIPFSNSYYLIFNYAPIFATGISLINFYKKRNWSNSMLPFFLLVLVGYKFGLITLILLVASSCVLLYFTTFIKPFFFLGAISYSLYLTHDLVLVVTGGILKRLQVDTNQNSLFWLLFEVLSAILVAYVFYILVEKRSLKWSKRIFYRN